MEEIGVKELLSILRKKLWVIVLVTVLLTAAGGIVSFYILEPEYQAYTTLMIGRPREYQQGINYDDVMLNRKLVSTYAEIAKSRAVTNEFMANLGMSMTYEELDRKIKVTLVPDTEIIKISVRDQNGSAAARIANEIANVFMKKVVIIMKIDNVQVIDAAEVPQNPDKPKPIVNMVISAVLGIIISVFSVFLYDYFDDTIKSQEDIEKYYMLPVLGAIPKA